MRPGESPAIPQRKANFETESRKMSGFKSFSKDPQSPFKNNSSNDQRKTEQPRNPWGPTFKDRQHFVDMHFN